MKNAFLTISLYVIAQFASGQATTGMKNGPTSDVTAMSLRELDLDGTPLEVFMEVTRAAGMSGGIVLSDPGCAYGPKKKFHIEAGTTLRHALNEIAAGTGSKWTIDNGVIIMFPLGGVPPLLATRIQKFEWDKRMSAKATVDRLSISPEVVQQIEQLGLKGGTTEGGATAVCIQKCEEAAKPEPAPQVEEDITLLAALNRVAAAHDRMVWAYLEYHCQKDTNYALYVAAE